MEMIEVRASCNAYGFRMDGIGLTVYGANPDGTRLDSVSEPLVLRPIEDGAVIEPTVRIHEEAAQRLMDDLWQCGMRPSEGTGSAGAMAKIEAHLEDMRTIAFDRLKIQKNARSL